MPKVVDIEEKRKYLMNAAHELFLEMGYKSVTTRQIAAKAGISKGTLYHYFKNKEDLFAQTIREHIIKTMIIKSALEDKTATPRERFLKLISLCDSSSEEREKRFHMMFDFMVYCTDKELVHNVINSIYEEARSVIRTIIKDEFEEYCSNNDHIQLFTNIIVAYLDGIHFQNLISRDKARLAEANSLFWEMIQNIMENPLLAPVQ